MKFKRTLIALAVILPLIIAGFFYGKYVIEHQDGYGATHEVNANIPDGFRFTDENEISENLLVKSEYRDIQQRGKMFSDDFYCATLHENAKITPYWKYTGGYGTVGGWSQRFAVSCGDEYLVVYRADHLGEAMYGPLVYGSSLPPSFNIDFHYGILAKTGLNTFNGTYTKDMVMNPSVTIPIVLTSEEISGIRKQFDSLNLFEEKARAENHTFVTPCESYDLIVDEDGTSRHLDWDCDQYGSNPDLETLADYVRSIVESKDAYKALPIPQGGYM